MFGPARYLTQYTEDFGTSRGAAIDRRLIWYSLTQAVNELGPDWLPTSIGEFGIPTYAGALFGESVPTVTIDFKAGLPIHRVAGSANLQGDLMLGCRPEVAGTLGAIISTQVLFTLASPLQGLATMLRLLAPGGVIIGTEPFLEHVSKSDRDQWGDFWRFTPSGLRRLLEDSGLEVVRVDGIGDARLGAALLLGMAVQDVPRHWMRPVPQSDVSPVLVGYLARRAQPSDLPAAFLHREGGH